MVVVNQFFVTAPNDSGLYVPATGQSQSHSTESIQDLESPTGSIAALRGSFQGLEIVRVSYLTEFAIPLSC